MPLLPPFRKLRGVRVQLLLWTILPLTVALIVLSLAGIFRHRQAMQQLVEQRDRGQVLAEASTILNTVQEQSALLASAAGVIPAGGGLPQAAPQRQQLFDRLGDNFSHGLALFDASGTVEPLAGSDPSWTTDDGVRAAVDRARSAGVPQFATLTPPAGSILADAHGGGFSDAGGTTHLVVAVPTPGGRVLAGLVPPDRLGMGGAGEHMRLEMGGGTLMLDAAGRPIYAANLENLVADPDVLRRALPSSGLAAGQAGTTSLSQGGRPDLLLAYAPIDPPGWLLVGVEDTGMINGAVVSLVEVLPMVVLFVAVLALLAVSFGMAAIVRPLQELDRRAARVAWGEFDAADQPVGGVQEIDDLRATLAQMAERIRAYQAGMRDYLSATTQAQEQERARLAHELHDDTVQALIALKQRAEMARKAVGSDPNRATERLDELAQLIDGELAGLRRLIGDLRPIYLEDLGFVPALEMLARQTQERFGLAVELQVRGEPVRMAPDVELTAFRIVQQALANVVAHASARCVNLAAEFGSDDLTLTVQDDGRGFTPPEQPADLARAGHFGIMGMRERAMLYGGYLNVVSAPGQGTTITAHLPAC